MNELQLRQLMPLLFESGHEVYAVANGAAFKDIRQKLHFYPYGKPHHQCLLRGELTPEQAKNAPYLIQLEKQHELFRWLIENGWGNWLGIFALAPRSYAFADILRHFRHLMKAVEWWEGGETVLLRYYDPRILQEMLTVSTLEEKRILYGPLHSYVVEGKPDHEPLSLPAPDFRDYDKAHGIDSLQQPVFRVRPEHFEASDERDFAMFKDEAVEHLKLHFPEQYSRYGLDKTREIVEQGIERAKTYGIDTEQDTVQFLSLMYLFGEDFDQNPKTAWVGQILNDPQFTDTKVKIVRLMQTASQTLLSPQP